VITIAGALGFDRLRMRWRLRRWSKSWHQMLRRSEQTVSHVRYQHKTCPACAAVADRDARVCASCGERLPSRAWQVLERVGVAAPSMLTTTTVLGALCVIAYLRLMAANHGGGVVSMRWQVLYAHGGNLTDAVAGGDWWRWGTAVLLHAGLWHLGFNLFALAIVGPHAEQRFGRLPVAALFMVTGVVGSAGSGWMGLPGVGIGASGAIMGLIGAVAASAHRDGTTAGRSLRGAMLKWAAYTMVFGFAVGADNWAHAFGFASGAAFGLAVRPAQLRRPRVRPIAAVGGAAGLAIALAATYAILVPPASRYERRLAVQLERQLQAPVAALIASCEQPTPAAGGCADLEAQRRKCSHGVDGFLPDDVTPAGRVYAETLCRLLGSSTRAPPHTP